ncbi:hypothetical protein K523DRAFT_73723 [Schizophyllum commune Tattone D]|nr:hypothetical protein K523DRAFT_73723 [Schizophyllum commune Tattone D]
MLRLANASFSASRSYQVKYCIYLLYRYSNILSRFCKSYVHDIHDGYTRFNPKAQGSDRHSGR